MNEDGPYLNLTIDHLKLDRSEFNQLVADPDKPLNPVCASWLKLWVEYDKVMGDQVNEGVLTVFRVGHYIGWLHCQPDNPSYPALSVAEKLMSD